MPPSVNPRRSYTVVAWCEENGARGSYRVEARSVRRARRLAAEEFREHCICAGAFNVPAAKNVHTEVERGA